MLACAERRYHACCTCACKVASPDANMCVCCMCSCITHPQAWASRQWIQRQEEMPPPPHSLNEMYLVHQAMQDHALAESAFGGLAGYKLGAVGVIQVVSVLGLRICDGSCRHQCQCFCTLICCFVLFWGRFVRGRRVINISYLHPGRGSHFGSAL
jgi:hypothetical protein